MHTDGGSGVRVWRYLYRVGPTWWQNLRRESVFHICSES